MKDGQRVSYIGPEANGVSIGDRGEVLSAGDNASHILFHTGSRQGAVILVDHYDLALGQKKVAATIDDGLDDSLEVGTLAVTGAREVYDVDGETGILNAMAEQGHLASFAAIAQEAHDLIQMRIRADPSFRSMASQLDDEEAESVIRLASAVLMRDAFGVEDI
jgi:hypothetical protein